MISKSEFAYTSTDGKYAMVFTNNAYRSGDITALQFGRAWPDYPLKTINNIANVECVSVGPAGNSEEFAIKRPISAGDKYRCLGTTFKVEKCFQDCKSAVIDRDVSTSIDGKSIRSYILVDRCAGLIAHSQTKNMTDGIPLDAVLLRGAVGILSDKRRAGCQ